MTQWITAQAARGAVVVSDPSTMAAVLMSALTNLPILRALIGKTPGDVAPSAFMSAWVDVAAKALQVPSTS